MVDSTPRLATDKELAETALVIEEIRRSIGVFTCLYCTKPYYSLGYCFDCFHKFTNTLPDCEYRRALIGK